MKVQRVPKSQKQIFPEVYAINFVNFLEPEITGSKNDHIWVKRLSTTAANNQINFMLTNRTLVWLYFAESQKLCSIVDLWRGCPIIRRGVDRTGNWCHFINKTHLGS